MAEPCREKCCGFWLYKQFSNRLLREKEFALPLWLKSLPADEVG